MKRLFVVALIMASAPVFADQYVQGHVRSDGTYVPGYFRSSPNSTTLDNYSTQGNYNPYTGQTGSQNPYAAPNPYQAPSSRQSSQYQYRPYGSSR